jgi:predicted DCC family thiol-disulfide oxidoreductase YuxK
LFPGWQRGGRAAETLPNPDTRPAEFNGRRPEFVENRAPARRYSRHRARDIRARTGYNWGMSNPRLTLYYDGLCPLCSREIDHYRRRLTGDAAAFVDITDPAFDAAAHGLDAGRVHRVMHVKVGDELRTGVGAFVAIWEAIPSHRWLARVARWPVVYPVLLAGYHLFAAVRPWLPRRKRAACSAGTCER